MQLDDLRQASFLVRGYALLLAAGVERVYWYLFRDYNEALMGLVRSDPLATPKPAFAAMAVKAGIFHPCSQRLGLGRLDFAQRKATPAAEVDVCQPGVDDGRMRKVKLCDGLRCGLRRG